jgi:hypothetical protein
MVTRRNFESALLTTVALLVGAPFSTAAPVTVDLRMSLTRICEYTTSIEPECIPQNEYVPVSLTYDPDNFVLHTTPEAWWVDLGPLTYDVPFAMLPNPWGPTADSGSGGVAYFSNNGPGFIEYREINLSIWESFYADSCADGFGCDWRTYFSLSNSTQPTPPLSGPPTTADVEALLYRGDIVFFTAALYDPPPIGGSRVYLPGSRLYEGRVPEPAVNMLLLAAGVAAALRRSGFRLRSLRSWHVRARDVD